MPVARSSKLSSTERRSRLAARIDRTGTITMSPCPQCVESGAVCIVHKSSVRCSACHRKNVPCGGTFSDAEFDTLEAQRTGLLLKKMEARSKLRSLAWELLALQKEHDSLDRQLDKVQQKQEEMIDQESRALDELDVFVGDEGVQLAMMSELDWSVDGPSFLQAGAPLPRVETTQGAPFSPSEGPPGKGNGVSHG